MLTFLFHHVKNQVTAFETIFVGRKFLSIPQLIIVNFLGLLIGNIFSMRRKVSMKGIFNVLFELASKLINLLVEMISGKVIPL